jgi:hypothetical protein
MPDRHVRRRKVFGEFDEPDHVDYGTKEAFEDAVLPCVDDQIRALPTSSAIAGSTTNPRPPTHTARSSTFRGTGSPAVVDEIDWVRPHAGAGEQLDGPSIEPVRECPAGSRG